MLESCSNSSHIQVIGLERSEKSQGIFWFREAGHPENDGDQRQVLTICPLPLNLVTVDSFRLLF